MQTQQEKQKLTVNFNHRLTVLGDGRDAAWTLVNTVEEMVLRATAILGMVGSQFAGEEGDCRMSDQIIYFSIEAAIKEIEDMGALVNAYHNAQNSQVHRHA